MVEKKPLNTKKGGYYYSRQWFDFAWENPDRASANHGMLYMWLIEINNRLGWAEKFQITARECMGGMLCKSHNTYIKCLNDLIEWGFVNLIKKSTNQYQCNVIALSKIDTSLYKALDKALIKHITDQQEITIQSTDSILKPLTTKPLTTNKPKARIGYSGEYEDFYTQYPRKVGKGKGFEAWRKLTQDEQVLASLAIPKYSQSVYGKDPNYIAHPASWLNGRRWEDSYESNGALPVKKMIM